MIPSLEVKTSGTNAIIRRIFYYFCLYATASNSCVYIISDMYTSAILQITTYLVSYTYIYVHIREIYSPTKVTIKA